MATRRGSLSGMGYVGFPALIFYEMMVYGTEETYEKNRTHLHKLYSYLRSYLPEVYNKDNKREFYNESIDPLLKDAAEQIDATRRLYRSTFEGVHTWSEDEGIFQTVMQGSFERLGDIVAMTGVIDKMKMEDMEMTV